MEFLSLKGGCGHGEPTGPLISLCASTIEAPCSLERLLRGPENRSDLRMGIMASNSGGFLEGWLGECM